MEVSSVESFLVYFERIRSRTRRVIDCIPPQHIDWTHHEGRWTFADLIRHIAATERFMFAENVAGNVSRYPGHGKDLADGYDAVVSYFNQMHVESVDLIRGLSDQDLQRKCETPGGAPIAVWKWLRAMIEHEVHHRGQIYIMLGMLGVETPPLWGLREEELVVRSNR